MRIIVLEQRITISHVKDRVEITNKLYGKIVYLISLWSKVMSVFCGLIYSFAPLAMNFEQNAPKRKCQCTSLVSPFYTVHNIFEDFEFLFY